MRPLRISLEVVDKLPEEDDAPTGDKLTRRKILQLTRPILSKTNYGIAFGATKFPKGTFLELIWTFDPKQQRQDVTETANREALGKETAEIISKVTGLKLHNLPRHDAQPPGDAISLYSGRLSIPGSHVDPELLQDGLNPRRPDYWLSNPAHASLRRQVVHTN